MKILIYSPAFFPSIGGLERIGLILCQEFVHKGHQVKVITTTRSNNFDMPDNFNFEIIRNPGFIRYIQLLKWCEIYYQRNISLKGLIAYIFERKPIVISHHGVYERRTGKNGFRDRLKLFIVQYTTNISISNFVAKNLNANSFVIYNPIDTDIFNTEYSVKRENKLVFLGRFVSQKGIDILLRALKIALKVNIDLELVLIGDGPEKDRLYTLIQELDIKKNISFRGELKGNALAEELNKYSIIIVPSLDKEGFGNVVLEGIACGCVPIVSNTGGLVEALGECGLTFNKGDHNDLANKIKILLNDDNKFNSFKSHFNKHLEKHKPEIVAKRYLEIFEIALNVWYE